MDPVTLARRVLAESGYLDSFRLTPRLDLAAMLKRFGVPWDRYPLRPGLAGALVVSDDEYRVVTNAQEGWARQRFTAAHEFKHYLADRGVARMFTCRRSLDTAIEKAANVFARELLMPPEVCRWLYGRGFLAPEELGRVLGVSEQAAGLRMAELDLDLGKEQVWWG